VGEEPDRIRAEIEQTRADMSDTVDALGYKADVKSRVKEKLPDTKQSAKRAKGVAQENPLGLAIGSIAVGFIAGMLIPSTRVEDEKIGSVADDVKEKVKETGSEALEHGKQVAQDAAQTVKESGQEHAQQVKDSARQSAEDVDSTTGDRPQYQTH
jgi:gas vesicle protein